MLYFNIQNFTLLCFYVLYLTMLYLTMYAMLHYAVLHYAILLCFAVLSPIDDYRRATECNRLLHGRGHPPRGGVSGSGGFKGRPGPSHRQPGHLAGAGLAESGQENT